MLPDKIRDLYGVLHVSSPKAAILLRKAQHKVVVMRTENGPIYIVHAIMGRLLCARRLLLLDRTSQKYHMFGEIECSHQRKNHGPKEVEEASVEHLFRRSAVLCDQYRTVDLR